MSSPRRALKPGGPAARHELISLLNTVWVAEAIRPSRFSIVSVPELSDGPAIDNRGGEFSGLEPGWGERIVRLSDMLLRALAHGGEVSILIRRRADTPNLFLARLRERAAESGALARLRVAEAATLPATGVFGDGFAITGAVAFTETGPDFAGEGVVFELDPTGDRRDKLRGVLEGVLR